MYIYSSGLPALLQLIRDPTESVCKLVKNRNQAISVVLPLLSVKLEVHVLSFELGSQQFSVFL